jgi:methylisocitrate lyase
VSELRSLLAGDEVVHAPGVINSLTALVAQQAGARVLYLSGAVTSAVELGRPDMGFVHGEHIAALGSRITSRVPLPLVADADTGYGNALQAAATVERYAAAGISGLHLEDQVSPKRCGHMAGKAVIDVAEASAKVRAAVDASAGRVVVIARTDARSVEGDEAALKRAVSYAEAGADALFVEGADAGLLERVHAELPQIPLLHNRSEAGGDVAADGLDDVTLAALGVRLVIHPVSALLAAAHAIRATYTAILRDGHAGSVERAGWSALTDTLGLPELLAAEQDYAT